MTTIFRRAAAPILAAALIAVLVPLTASAQTQETAHNFDAEIMYKPRKAMMVTWDAPEPGLVFYRVQAREEGTTKWRTVKRRTARSFYAHKRLGMDAPAYEYRVGILESWRGRVIAGTWSEPFTAKYSEVYDKCDWCPFYL